MMFELAAVNMTILITVLISALVLLFAAAVFILYFTICDKIFRKVFRRPRPMPQVDRSPSKIDQDTIIGRGRNWFYTNRMEFLNVRIKSYDGTPLCGYFRPSFDRESRNVVILVHGYDEHPSKMAAYAKLIMSKIQCHVIIVHQRAHHMSGGKIYSYGLMESVDLDSWISFAKRQAGADARIYLMGRSMGATTCLLAAAQKDFSPNVVGIIADCPLANLEEGIKNKIREEYKLNANWFIGRVRALGIKKYGLDIRLVDCAINASRIKVPVLLFVGSEDSVASPEGCRRIFDNLRSAKRMVVVDGASHLECYDKAQALYEREVQKIIERCVVRLVKMGRM